MQTITYEDDGNLYVNLTNQCDCDCVFCIRHNGSGEAVFGHSLWLDRAPSREEALADLRARDLRAYGEIVFCGFGEPMFRADDIFWLADRLQAQAAGLPPLRINTNGHADLILGRDVTPELAGRIDALSISLNAPTQEEYVALTRPRDGARAWQAMLEFTRRAARYVPTVTLSIVDKDRTPEDIAACRALAQRLGATLRVRVYVAE